MQDKFEAADDRPQADEATASRRYVLTGAAKAHSSGFAQGRIVCELRRSVRCRLTQQRAPLPP
jgi:hypothetical protein